MLVWILAWFFPLSSEGQEISREKRVREDLLSFRTQLSAYEMLAGELPTTAQGLQALVVEPKPKPKRWQQFFLRIPPDPWGNDFVYVRPGKHNPQSYDLFSKGPDGLENTADDIGNW